MKKYIVKLGEEEREELRKLIAQGQAPARKLAHARILLKADSGEGGSAWSDQAESRSPRSWNGHGGARAAALCGRRAAGSPHAAPAQQVVCAQIGRRAGGVCDRPDLFTSGARARSLDVADAGRQAGRSAVGGKHCARNDPTDA